MSLFRQFGTDRKKEMEGVAVKYAPNDDKTVPTFYICRIGGIDSPFEKRFAVLMKPYKYDLDNGSVPDSVLIDLQMQAFVETTLKGWEHIQDENGKTVKFTQTNALAYFKKLPELYMNLFKKANSMELFKRQELETDLKN